LPENIHGAAHRPAKPVLPVIASPMFIASGPALVAAQCKAGIVGSFPALNARPAELLDTWLTDLQRELAITRKPIRREGRADRRQPDRAPVERPPRA
jgi:NAD(P)H-dependent flavin oxidoreductase YrpB (nitropropane dioxygenase family)